MESGSQASDPGERTSQPLANLIGTAIALLTLAVPLMAIAHFSSASSSADSMVWQPPAQAFSQRE